jgi:NACHT domain
MQWDEQKHNTMMQWLLTTDFPAQHDIINRRQDGTGQWFLDSLEFKTWLQGHRTLFCPGIPGAGKTMIAAIAIDYLCEMARGDNIGVAYLFCSYKAQVDQSVSNLFTALLKQLVQCRPDIAAPVAQIYDKHSKKRSRPSLDEILQALNSICSNYTTVYIIVDALDECADRDGTRGRLIDTLRDLQARLDVRLLFTSRPIPAIIQKFQSDAVLEVRAREEDVRRFIDGQIPRLPNCIQRDEELKRTIQNKIIEAVDGM